MSLSLRIALVFLVWLGLWVGIPLLVLFIGTPSSVVQASWMITGIFGLCAASLSAVLYFVFEKYQLFKRFSALYASAASAVIIALLVLAVGGYMNFSIIVAYLLLPVFTGAVIECVIYLSQGRMVYHVGYIKRFTQLVTDVLSTCPQINYEWFDGEDNSTKVLLIHKVDDSGFDIRLEYRNHCIHPRAAEWRGEPWSMSSWPEDEFHEVFSNFLRALLSADSELTVSYINQEPYRWILRYSYCGETVEEKDEKTGGRYRGEVMIEKFQNTHVPPVVSVVQAG